MRFAVSVATAVMAFAASAFAQTADFDPIYTPAKNEIIPAGSTYKVTWKAPAKYPGTVQISLIGGKTQDTQVPITTVASGVANTADSYEWAVDSNLGTDAVYGLVFKYESDTSIFQYSNPFHIKAGSGSYPTGSASTTKTTSTGIKTVTLSSQPYSTPEVTTTTAAITTSFAQNTTTIAKPTYTAPSNSTIVKSTTTPVTVITSTAIASATGPAPTQPTVVPTGAPGAASRVGAGSLALVSAIVMALLI